MEDSFIEIGRIGRCHGLKGEVHVASYAESPEIFAGALWLSDGRNPPVRHEVAKRRVLAGQGILLIFKGFEDRTAAETLRGLDILIEADKLPELAEDEVYLHELIGLTVEDAESGERLGVLERVDLPAGQEIWVIATPDGKEILFPAVEEFIEAIDLEAGLARIVPPPGLLDLYLS